MPNTNAGYLVATDKFLSGWGKAKGKSYICYDLTGLSGKQIDKLETWMRKRDDFKNVRYAQKPPRCKDGDHVDVKYPPERAIS